jgi:REP element-mobilizing transposase RayT
MSVGEAASFPICMAEPPRLSEIQLPWEKSIIYFVTMCVKDRHKVLANRKIFSAIKVTIPALKRWNVLAAVVMPDHAHFIVSPMEDRDLSVGDFATGFKRLLRKQLAPQLWEWQRGCFDRLLRSDENLGSKWIYVQDNPVRAGLAERVEDWPFYLDYVNITGKLTASPTEGSFTGVGGS